MGAAGFDTLAATAGGTDDFQVEAEFLAVTEAGFELAPEPDGAAVALPVVAGLPVSLGAVECDAAIFFAAAGFAFALRAA